MKHRQPQIPDVEESLIIPVFAPRDVAGIRGDRNCASLLLLSPPLGTTPHGSLLGKVLSNLNVPRCISIGRPWLTRALLASGLLMAVLLLISSAAMTVASEATSLEVAGGAARITSVKIGLGGKFKVGSWTPVHVSVNGGEAGFAGKIEFVAADNDLLATTFAEGTASLVEVPRGESWSGWRYFKVGRMRGTMRVLLRNRDGEVVHEQTLRDAFPQPSTWQWVVTVGTDVGVDEAAVFLARMRDEKLMSSNLTDPDQFPDQWFGYEGVNVLLVPAGEVNPLESLSDRQFAALLDWLRLGGRLVLSAGRRAPELFGAEHRFRTLRPGEFLELDVYWKASGLEHFARAGERVRVDESGAVGGVLEPGGSGDLL